MGSSAAFYFLPTEYKNYTYGISALLGIGCTTLLVTALEMISALIGDSTESGAFVYGALSLTDKASNGAAIIVIQVRLLLAWCPRNWAAIWACLLPCRSGCCYGEEGAPYAV